MRIALATLPFPDSPDDAVARCAQAMHDARHAGAAIVCVGECYVPGYRAPNRAVPPPDAAWLARAHGLLAQTAHDAGIAAVIGTERVVDGAVRATALVLDAQGSVLGWQDKVQLDPSEDTLYAPGAGRRVFTVGALTFGVVICHEGWRYPESVRSAARQGAQLVFHPHFSEAEPGAFQPTVFGDPRNSFHEQAVRCRAAENGIWFASVNYALEGAPASSAVSAPDGTLVAWHPYGVAGLLLADLDLAAATGLLARRLRPRDC
ncbi:MAG: carbon-nitrogen hydrolase family protein [Gemmatimonadetes bacterium]|nr:carbon-nitrogen hydrolase family protein [Gemmatimonadota bacterium]